MVSDTSGFIEQRWLNFARKVLPKKCSQIQYTEMRKAFYAGVLVMIQGMRKTADTVTEKAAEDWLDGIFLELKDFYETLVQEQRHGEADRGKL